MSNVIVFGASGFLGSALVRANPDCVQVTSKDFDACDPVATGEWFDKNKLMFVDSTVHLCSGVVSGQHDIKDHRQMFEKNFVMTMNLVSQLAKHQSLGVTVNYSSTMVYPQEGSEWPEQSLFTGAWPGAKDGYSLAKAAGQRYCQYWNRELSSRQFVNIVVPNIWGPNDKYDIGSGHVLPAMSDRILTARLENRHLELMGSPRSAREFVHVDDVARATATVLASDQPLETVNVGQGETITIGEIVDGLVRRLDYRRSITWQDPDGQGDTRLCDSSLLRSLGWQPQHTYQEMLDFYSEQIRVERGFV